MNSKNISTIEKAISIALNAHEGQKRLDGRPYIMHPLRMASKAKNENEIIVSILHDVIEDSSLSLKDLVNNGFSDETIKSIDLLTHREDEDYFHYINRICPDKLAKCVKILDIQDNLDYNEWPNFSSYLNKLEVYYKAIKILESYEDG